MIEIDTVIADRYRILSKLGQGGMSIVYLALDECTNKHWAIKEVRKDGKQNYEVVKQGLVAETKILKELNHPNLPKIEDVLDEGDFFLIVMDYIEGKTLSEKLQEKGTLQQDFVIQCAWQLCDVLDYLHTRKPSIIYRDMKPSNIMVKPDGSIVLIDFGTAREYKTEGIQDTTCLGTRGYAAPEQFGGMGQSDARTDIYCLGATLYHLLTGHNPSQPPYEIYPIRRWNKSLSIGLEQIITKCTQRNPNDRFQSCKELAQALQEYDALDNARKMSNSIKAIIAIAGLILAVVTGGGLLSILFVFMSIMAMTTAIAPRFLNNEQDIKLSENAGSAKFGDDSTDKLAEQTILLSEQGENELESESTHETMMLSDFRIIQHIMLVHTEEIIE